MASLAAPQLAGRRADATPSIRVQEVCEYRELLDLEPIWDRIAERARCDSPFLEFGWIRAWWESFAGKSTPNVLVVWQGDEPIALAPLIRSSVRLCGIAVRQIGFFYNSHVPRTGFVIGADAEAAYDAIWNRLRADDSWDLLQLCQLPEESETAVEMLRRAQQSGHPTGVWQSGKSPFVPLDTSWQAYSQSLSAKHRSNLRNRIKRLMQLGAVDVETISQDAGLGDALSSGFELEAAAWKGKEGTAIACTPELGRFYTSFARYAAQRGWLRINFLRVNRQRIAFDYSLAYKGQIFLLKQGYDPAFAAYSPSNLLIGMELEAAFTQGFSKFDFLGDFAEWKRQWATESVHHRWLYVFSKRFKGILLHRIKFELVPLAKKAFGRN